MTNPQKTAEEMQRNQELLEKRAEERRENQQKQ